MEPAFALESPFSFTVENVLFCSALFLLFLYARLGLKDSLRWHKHSGNGEERIRGFLFISPLILPASVNVGKPKEERWSRENFHLDFEWHIRAQRDGRGELG